MPLSSPQTTLTEYTVSDDLERIVGNLWAMRQPEEGCDVSEAEIDRVAIMCDLNETIREIHNENPGVYTWKAATYIAYHGNACMTAVGISIAEAQTRFRQDGEQMGLSPAHCRLAASLLAKKPLAAQTDKYFLRKSLT